MEACYLSFKKIVIKFAVKIARVIGRFSRKHTEAFSRARNLNSTCARTWLKTRGPLLQQSATSDQLTECAARALFSPRTAHCPVAQ